MNTVTHIAATTAHGVFVFNPIDFPEAEYIQNVHDFLDQCASLEDGEWIFFAADQEQMAIISEQYNIDLVGW